MFHVSATKSTWAFTYHKPRKTQPRLDASLVIPTFQKANFLRKQSTSSFPPSLSISSLKLFKFSQEYVAKSLKKHLTESRFADQASRLKMSIFNPVLNKMCVCVAKKKNIEVVTPIQIKSQPKVSRIVFCTFPLSLLRFSYLWVPLARNTWFNTESVTLLPQQSMLNYIAPPHINGNKTLIKKSSAASNFECENQF